MLDLRYISPDRLHDVWDEISEGLETCRKQDPDDVWMEDIYHVLKLGHATLHVGYVDGVYVGFIILNINTDPYSGAKRLNIWYLHSSQGDVIWDGLAQVENFARQSGATCVTYSTNRAALERYGKRLGFQTYEIRVKKDL